MSGSICSAVHHRTASNGSNESPYRPLSAPPSPSRELLGDKLKAITHLTWKIIPFSALPDWLRDNEYILGSYRPPMFSFEGCFKSIFRLHNETLNIWTHLLGCLFFVVLVAGVYIFGDYITGLFEDVRISELPRSEQAMIFLFFSGAIICLLCSTLYHVLLNHSQKVSLLFSRLDYSGISFLITGSSIPAYYYGFYCTKIAQFVHISILVVLCAVCVTISMWSKFSHPKYRVFRFVLFVLFGLYGAIPFVHIYLRDGYMLASNIHPFWGIINMAALYIVGGSLYAARIPERFWPGAFDIWASSHQIFHIFVVTAALIHYNSLLKMIKYRLDVGNSCLDISFELPTTS